MTPRLHLNVTPYELANLNGASNVFPGSGNTGEPIAAEVSCNDNELVITPATSVSNREIENQLLRAQVQFIKDLAADTSAYAQYSAGVGWVGPLTPMPVTNVDMYQADMQFAGSFPFIGFVIDPDATAITCDASWNRISYTPQLNLVLSEALAGLTPDQDDQLKGQMGFAQFDANYGWYGSLDHLEPGAGYMLHLAAADTHIYPSGYGREAGPALEQPVDKPVELAECPWMVDKYKYVSNMTITGLIESDTLSVNNPNDAVGVFVGDECRGVARPIYVPQIEAYRIYLQIYGATNETLTFRIWQADGDLYYESGTTRAFQADARLGSLTDPLMIVRTPLGIGDRGYIPDRYSLSQNYPNPCNLRTTMGFGLPEDSHVRIRIYNMLGQEVRTLVDSELSAGYRFAVWNSLDSQGRPVGSGIYLVVMESGPFREIHKLLMLK